MAKRIRSIYQLLSSNGDGTGDYNAIGDYSASPVSFFIGDNINNKSNYGKAIIERIIISLQDSGSLDSGYYGNGLSLINGIRLRLLDREGSVIQEYTPIPIKTNGGWAKACHDLTNHNFGSGDSILTARFTFSKSGQPITVNTHRGERFEVLLNDSFVGIIEHLFFVQGYYQYYQELL